MSEISCKNLCLGYDGNVIIKDLSFCVERGNYLAVVGENGSGKTTLMKTLLGLMRPLDGKISFGEELLPKDIGYLPQQTALQKDFPASVTEVVLSGCLSGMGMRPFFSKKEKALARQNIEKMGMAGFERRSYRELSGGQQQRVLLARALCAAKRMLLLDEPVSGLDPKATADMYELIEKLNKDGTTIIMISHDIAAAQKYATHILHIGADVFFGTKEDYILRAKHAKSTSEGGESNG